MKYKVNWIKTKKGNGIKSGKTLNVEIGNAYIVSGFVAKKTWYGKKMLLIDQGKDKLKFLLKKKGGNFETGKYILKVVAYDKKQMKNTWTDEFEIV
jgi:hypothetical protein